MSEVNNKFMIEIPNQYVKNLYKLALAFFIILSVYFAVKILSEFRSYRNAGQSFNSITLSGHGEVYGSPDIASVSFSISKDAKTVKDAQDAVAKVEKSALDFLRENKIADKDIKTINASFNPKYEYQQKICPQTMGADGMMTTSYYCGGGKQVLTGYEAHESITVKVRNVDDAGKIMQGLGALAVTDLNGPNFAIDDEDGLKAEARKQAIEDARSKAEVLAKDLGVHLGKILSYSDNNSPMPMYYDGGMMASEMSKSASAELPKGENLVSSDVTITFEIR